MLVADDPRLAVGVLHVAGVHDRHRVVDRPHDREPDEVGEGHLPAAGAAEVAVDHPPVDLEQLGRDAPEAGGGGDLEAGLHVGDDAGGRPADRLADRLGGRGGAGRRLRRRRRGGAARPGAAAPGAAGAGRRRPPSSGARRRAGSRRRSPASSRSPTSGRRGTARASRRRARRSDRGRRGGDRRGGSRQPRLRAYRRGHPPLGGGRRGRPDRDHPSGRGRVVMSAVASAGGDDDVSWHRLRRSSVIGWPSTPTRSTWRARCSRARPDRHGS